MEKNLGIKNTYNRMSEMNELDTQGYEEMKELDFETTAEIPVPEKLIDQVIGQEHAVEIIKKAAQQKRHVLLIGTPGTGKSMLARAMAELLPREELEDILIYPNPDDPNNPKVKVVRAGQGKIIVDKARMEARQRAQSRNSMLFFLLILLPLVGFMAAQWIGMLTGIMAAAILMVALRSMIPRETMLVPKLLVSNADRTTAPFVDATGAHAGALLGDVRHDPFQSGGLETPAHERVEAGAIHKAHRGVLFIDEIHTLKPESQQNLLTAMQEGEFPITGQSERSSGAMVKTDPVPCKFIMVAAGNIDAMRQMHPALRSRIKGYGYEVYMRDVIDDTPENRRKLARFVAQEVKKDGKIPHFTRDAVIEIIREARRRAGRKGKLTLVLRDLGGLVRAAGDIAVSEGCSVVKAEHVIKAKELARSIEQQVVDRYLEQKQEYQIFKNEGAAVGCVNGLAVMGDSGIILPIKAEVTPALSREEGRVIATGRLQEIAQEAVQNVSAIIKKITGEDIRSKDVHIQFIGTYEGVEGDSASISVATAVISALEGIPVDQSVAMTGSLSIRGEVLPVGGITYKIESAIRAGMKKVIIPKANMNDVLLEKKYENRIQIIPVERIEEVLEHSLIGKKKKGLLEKIREFVTEIPASAISKDAAPQV